jgi:hypothetical protein
MENGIRHKLSTAAGTLCVLSFALCSFNCVNKPLAPVAPTWETQMTAPLSLRSYTLADLAAKDSNFFPSTPGIALAATFSPAGALFSDTVSIGDSSGSGPGHTLVDQKTAGDFNAIQIHVVVDNGIPLQLALKLKFLDTANRLLITIPQSSGDSIIVPAPVVLGGTVQSPSHTERIISLADTEIQQFNSTHSLVYFLQISAPGTDLLALVRTQAINIRIWAEFSFQVNK